MEQNGNTAHSRGQIRDGPVHTRSETVILQFVRDCLRFLNSLRNTCTCTDFAFSFWLVRNKMPITLDFGD